MLGETISRNGCYGCSHAHTHGTNCVFSIHLPNIKTCDVWGSTRLNFLLEFEIIDGPGLKWKECKQYLDIYRKDLRIAYNKSYMYHRDSRSALHDLRISSWCWVCRCGVRWCWQRLGVMEQGQRQRLHAGRLPGSFSTRRTCPSQADSSPCKKSKAHRLYYKHCHINKKCFGAYCRRMAAGNNSKLANANSSRASCVCFLA